MSAHIPGFGRPLRRTETLTDKNGAIAGLDQALVGSEAKRDKHAVAVSTAGWARIKDPKDTNHRNQPSASTIETRRETQHVRDQ